MLKGNKKEEMMFEEIPGYEKFIESCSPSRRVFLGWYFDHLDKSMLKGKDKARPGAIERHHIVPRSHGGSDDEENIVHLLFKDHVIAHYLLFRAFRNGEMSYAFSMMINRSASEFSEMSEEELGGFLDSLQESREIYGERRSFIAKEKWGGEKNPNKGKVGKDHPVHGKIIIHKGNRHKRVPPEDIQSYFDDGWEVGMAGKTKNRMKGKKVGYIKVNDGKFEKSVPESELDVHLATGWEVGRLDSNVEHQRGKARYATSDGVFYGMLNKHDPVIQGLGLILHVTEATRESCRVAMKFAADKNRGSTVYNNGLVQKRLKEHPGEGWVIGGLPISEEIKKAREEAGPREPTGVIVYNDGIRCYRVNPGDYVDPSWERGMAPQKKRGPTKIRGTVVYNDGEKIYKVPSDQAPMPHWKKGMLPRKKKD